MPERQQTREEWLESLPWWERGWLGLGPRGKEQPVAQPAQLTWTAGEILGELGYPIPPEATFAEPTPRELIGAREPEEEDELERMMREAQERALRGWETPIPGGAQEGIIVTLADGSRGYWLRDPESGQPFFQRLTQPTPQAGEISPYQEEQVRLREQEMQLQRQQHQQMLMWQREQQQRQLAAEKEARLAQLRANPASWLEYAALSGQPPVIQPWMLPLARGQYAEASAGEPLPTDYTQLPTLTTPSTQYQARMGPTAQRQYYGYEKARTGATPEETQWRLWSQAPPGGTSPGLTQLR